MLNDLYWWKHRKYTPPSPPPNAFSAPMLIANPNNPQELLVVQALRPQA